MENGPFEDVFPIRNGDMRFPEGISLLRVAHLGAQLVYSFKVVVTMFSVRELDFSAQPGIFHFVSPHMSLQVVEDKPPDLFTVVFSNWE